MTWSAPSLLREVQPIVRKIDGNDRSRPQHARLHHEAHSERPCSQHDHRIVEAERLARKRGNLLRAVQSHGYRHDFSEHGDF